jgi:hypothetical protein
MSDIEEDVHLFYHVQTDFSWPTKHGLMPKVHSRFKKQPDSTALSIQRSPIALMELHLSKSHERLVSDYLLAKSRQ